MNTSNFNPPRTTHARRVVPQGPNITSGADLTQRIPFSAGNASSSLKAPVETGITECDPEATLAGSIERLWLIDKDKKSSLRLSRQEMTENRVALAKNLAELKSLLGGRGRDGAWLPFLRQLCIPRSTAEGLIRRHMAGSSQTKASGMLTTLTKEDIPKVLKAIRPKLVHVSTRELADQFVSELVVMLDRQIAKRATLQSIDVGDQLPGIPVSSQPRHLDPVISIDDL